MYILMLTISVLLALFCGVFSALAFISNNTAWGIFYLTFFCINVVNIILAKDLL